MTRQKFYLKQWELVRDDKGDFLADIRVCGILETLGEIGVNKKCPFYEQPDLKCRQCGTFQRFKELKKEGAL